MNTQGRTDILIVDDEPTMRDSMVAALPTDAYRCAVAGSAMQARKKLENTPFALVLLDVSLPGTSGIDFAGYLAATYPDTALIMVTMIDEVDTAVRCMKAGAMDYLTKPPDPAKLRRSVARALQSRTARIGFREYQLNLEKAVHKEKEMRTEFLHSVAHEIKTPLTAIISSSEMLQSGAEPGGLGSRMADTIKRNAWALNEKINDMATLDNLAAGTRADRLHPLDIRFALRELAKLVHDPLAYKNQSIMLEMANRLPCVAIEVDDFRRIMLNLISNASRYSPDGSRIFVRARDSGKATVIEVEDEAHPIPEDERHRLFEIYYRGEDEEQIRRIPGLGVGLYVARRMVELYGGELRLTNRLKNGNIFTVTFPHANDIRKAAATRQADEDMLRRDRQRSQGSPIWGSSVTGHGRVQR